MPKGEAIGDDVDAPDRNVQVHVRELDVAYHSGARFTALAPGTTSRCSTLHMLAATAC